MVPVLQGTVSDPMLIIGTALDGPTNQVVRVSDLETAISAFGPMVFKGEYVNPATSAADNARAGNDLVEAIEKALAAGCNNILAVRVPGARATADIDTTGTPATNVLQLLGLFDGDAYNGIVLSISTGASNYSWQLQQPAQRGGTISGTIPNSGTVRDLVSAVNNHPNNHSARLVVHPTATDPEAELNRPLSDIVASPRTFTTSGGLYGIRSQRVSATDGYKSLLDLLTDPASGTFISIGDADVDVVHLSCLYADDQVATDGSDSVIPHFAKFVAGLSAFRGCHGVLGARPYVAPDAVSLNAYYQAAYLSTTTGMASASEKRIKIGPFLAKHSSMVVTTNDGGEVDYGRFISVVIGMPVRYRSWQLGEAVSDAAAHYAGMLTVLSPAEIAAFRTPNGILSVEGAPPSRALMDQLMNGVQVSSDVFGGGYVVMRPALVPGGRPIVANDLTAAQSDSVFHLLSNVRITNAVSKYLRQALIPFLGRPNTQETLAAMSTAVRGVLNRFVEIQALLGGEGVGYRFTLYPVGGGLQTVEVRCTVDLRPMNFIRVITLDLTVTL